MRIIKTIPIMLIAVITMILTTGCTNKTYDLIGIVDSETNEIVLTSEIKNAEIKSHVETYKNATIKLRANGRYVMKFDNISGYIRMTYTTTGTYTIEEKVLTLKTEPQEDSETDALTNRQQYIDGKIIYYDGTTFLCFA